MLSGQKGVQGKSLFVKKRLAYADKEMKKKMGNFRIFYEHL